MKPYLALIRLNLRLAVRERAVLFFNYVFPLIFFFAFGQFMSDGNAGAGPMLRVIPMVIVIGILGSGLFGAGIRAVIERETGILRRYKVAPISPAPILVASMVTGWILYLPSVVLIILLAHFAHGMPIPERWLSLLILVTLASFAFRAVGLIVASVANSVAESNVLIQILYMPMLFLSGATLPVSSLPPAAQIAAQFMPAAYLNTGIQHVMLRSEGIAANLESVAAMLVTIALGTFIAIKLFRWEKEERLPRKSKAWVLAVLAPFILMGTYQAWTREHIAESKQLDREIRRNHTRLIRNATIFTGDGRVIPNGAILIRGGRIAEVYSDQIPDPDSLRADAVEAAGKTLLPGLIDVQVGPGGDTPEALASQLFCGVVAVGAVAQQPAQRPAGWSGAELVATPAAPTYIPALAAEEAALAVARRDPGPLSRTLVQQSAFSRDILQRTALLLRNGGIPPRTPEPDPARRATELRRAFELSTPLLLGTRSGEPLVFHGPSIHRELQLWVQAGVPASAALRAATFDAATSLGIGGRTGAIRKGYEASILIVDGNPLTDISATERISSVIFKGERIDRQDLLSQK